MKALSLNFAWQQPRRGRYIGWLLLSVALGLGSFEGWTYWQLNQQLDQWQSDWQRLQRIPKSPRALKPEDKERLQLELRFANRVIERLDTPWSALFDAVEHAFGEQVTLLNVEPDTERREVRLTAEAKDMGAMLEYVKQVRQSPVLKDAYLASHQINQQDPQRPVRFVVNARWVAPLPEAAPSAPAEITRL